MEKFGWASANGWVDILSCQNTEPVARIVAVMIIISDFNFGADAAAAG